MGIPQFFKWIITKNKSIIKDTLEINNATLYFDFNALIHPVAQFIIKKQCSPEYTEELIVDKIYKGIIEYTTNIINLVNPKKIYIVMDGIAPIGKMKQQKERRFRSIIDKKHLENLKDEFSKINKTYFNNATPEIYWNTNQISPYTTFMTELSNKLKLFIPNAILSDTTEMGEGEHKIIDIIRKNPDGQHIIYGLDADMIILTMLLNNDNIYLLREKQYFGRTDLQKEFDISKPDMNYLYLNILNNYITEPLNGKLTNYNKQRILDDFCILSFFIGNDFIPRQNSFNIKSKGFDYLLYHYYENVKKYNQYLLNNDKINFFLLSKILYNFRNEWDNLLKSRKFTENFNPKNDELDPFKRFIKDKEFIRDSYTSWINEKTSFEEYKYIHNMYYFGTNEPILINSITKSYLSTFIWVWNYYKYGKMINWEWFYQFNETPLLTDIINYCYKHEDLETPLYKNKFNYTNINKLSYTQLYNILPNTPENNKILKDISIKSFGKDYTEELDKKYKEYRDYNNTSFNPQNCIFYYEQHLKTPPIIFREIYTNLN